MPHFTNKKMNLRKLIVTCPKTCDVEYEFEAAYVITKVCSDIISQSSQRSTHCVGLEDRRMLGKIIQQPSLNVLKLWACLQCKAFPLHLSLLGLG